MPLLGVALHAHIAALGWEKAGSSAWVVGLFALSTIPYVLCLLVGRLGRPVHGTIGAVLCLALDLAVYYSVFIAPASSTAPLALIFAPFFDLIVLAPAGFVVTALVHAVRRRWNEGQPPVD